MINVVNKHNFTGDGIYIGRGSVLGNPFTHIKFKETKAIFITKSRDEAIKKYEQYLRNEIETGNQEIINQLEIIKNLSDKGIVNLICYCHPKPCHGHIIIKIVDEMEFKIF